MASLSRVDHRRSWLWAGAGSLIAHSTLILLLARLGAMGVNRRPSSEIEVDILPTPPSAFDREVPDPEVPVPEGPAPVTTAEALRPTPARVKARSHQATLARALPADAPTQDLPRPFEGAAGNGPAIDESPAAEATGATSATANDGAGAGSPHPPAFGTGGFSPVAADRIAVAAQFDVDDAVYPAQAEREAIEGNVVLEVGVDREGRVRSVEVLQRAGYGMDENAVRAVWRHRAKPCQTRAGLAIDCRVRHIVHFQPAKSEVELGP